MRKRERTIITSIVMIMVIIVCLFSDIVFRPGEAYGYTEKIGVVDIESKSSLNVRDGVGTTGTKVIGKLNDGAVVTITGESKASDGMLWYHIEYGSLVGYVSSAFVTNVQDKVGYTEDADFEAYLNAQGFPESYKDALRVLHEKYPKWVFVADHLTYTWAEALKNQSIVGRSLITKNAISSWKSLEEKSYNWNTGQWYTFDGGSWCAASQELVAYYMDPRNFLNDTYIWMFEQLSYQSEFQTIDKLEKILVGTFMETGKNPIINDETGLETSYAEVLMIAAAKSQVSPFHLAASILVEMGNSGGSNSISGTVEGYENLYNYYNWGAYAHDGRGPITNGLIYAGGTDTGTNCLRPWNTRYKGVVGGAIKLGLNYINIGQDTLYYKKFDYIGSPYSHQYMTHIRAHEIEAQKTAKAYTNDVKSNTSIVFKIPVYKDMPEIASVLPTDDGNPNNCLASLSITDQVLTPTFGKFTTEYTLVVDNSVTSVEVNATSIISSTTVTGTGAYELKEGSNTISVVATAENGSARTYTITVVRRGINDGVGDDSSDGTGDSSSGETSTEEPTTEPLVFNTTLVKNDAASVISGINSGTSIADMASKLTVTGGTVEIQDSSGNVKTEGMAATGDKIIVKNLAGEVVYSYNVVIYGDVNGDGNIGLKDLLVVRKYILGASTLEGLFLDAGNTNRDENGVSIKDVLVLRKYILGASTISQD